MHDLSFEKSYLRSDLAISVTSSMSLGALLWCLHHNILLLQIMVYMGEPILRNPPVWSLWWRSGGLRWDFIRTPSSHFKHPPAPDVHYVPSKMVTIENSY